MKPPVLSGDIAPFFTQLLGRYLADEVTAASAMRYVVALFICGRSGAGKDTLRRYLIDNEPRLGRVITTTTRPPEQRNGRMEVHGEDYYFVTRERFAEMWQNGDLLEQDTFAHNSYGCSVEGVLRVLASGKIPILQITFEGVDAILPKLDYLRGRGIFISASRQVVEARIRHRAKHDGKSIDERALALRLQEGDEEELFFKPRFTEPFGVVVLNDDLAAAQAEIWGHAQRMVAYLNSACALSIANS